jgi:hypothetical protein
VGRFQRRKAGAGMYRVGFCMYSYLSCAGRGVPGVTLALNEQTAATRVEFSHNSLDGKASSLPVQKGQVTLEAREKLVIVLAP